jgi:osmotically inducible lipoprotein OsmB
MKRSVVTSLMLVSLAFALAGCGYNQGDRAASGGLIGAGGGAAIAAIAGANPLVGAAIGAGAGALGGALTNPNTVNLGQPIWR